MSNPHINAVRQCSQFKGTARWVLFVLADAASPGPKNEEDKILPLGYCKRKLQTLMAAVNITRQQTVSAAIKELVDAGVIKQHLQKGVSPLYFVDIDWLKERAYTADDLLKFEYPALKVSRLALAQEGEGSPQRETANLGNVPNAKRLTSPTETVGEYNGNRWGMQRQTANSIPTYIPNESHLSFPPAEAGSRTLSTASRDPGAEQLQLPNQNPLCDGESLARLDKAIRDLGILFSNPIKYAAYLSKFPVEPYDVYEEDNQPENSGDDLSNPWADADALADALPEGPELLSLPVRPAAPPPNLDPTPAAPYLADNIQDEAGEKRGEKQKDPQKEEAEIGIALGFPY
jgi:hypothetical protein